MFVTRLRRYVGAFLIFGFCCAWLLIAIGWDDPVPGPLISAFTALEGSLCFVAWTLTLLYGGLALLHAEKPAWPANVLGVVCYAGILFFFERGFPLGLLSWRPDWLHIARQLIFVCLPVVQLLSAVFLDWGHEAPKVMAEP